MIDINNAPLPADLVPAIDRMWDASAGKILAIDGLRLLQIDDIIYTHLDRDHAHPGWCSASGCRAVRRIHRRHIRRAERDGHAYKRCEVFEDVFDLGESVRVSPVLSSHDQFGVSVFRFDIGGAGGSRASMGFATDVGTITDGWPDHVRGVDVLAIESNYCPDLQIASDRPEFLKQRIMGGSGHLSNQESAVAAQHIAPEQRLVLLHLSQQCNSAELAQRAHAVHTRANPRLEVTVTTQNEPTPWLWVTACRPRPMGTPRVTREPSLFDVASDAP
ncbi:MAG: MBL fold metallo-hydrolase [Planctomycetota bacterium]